MDKCPQCQGFLQSDLGSRFCRTQGCFYTDIHPLNYQNDVVQFEGQTSHSNRYSSLFHKCFQNGGNAIGRESLFDANFKRAKKMICNCCFILKLSQSLADLAESRCFKVLKMIYLLKMQNQKEDKKQRHRNFYSVKNVAYYCVFSACFQKQNYFEQFNICKFSGIQLSVWKDVIRQLNNFLKNKIQYIPITQAKHVILRVCRKRKIKTQQQKAMIEMSERIIKSGEFDIRNNTIAAISFWKVCQFSYEYYDQMSLNQICRNHEKMLKDGVRHGEIWKHFDVTPQNVRKVFKESISNRLNQFLPVFKGQIPVQKRSLII